LKFEDFERNIRKKGYLIIGMNHYRQNGKIHIFCAIMNPKSKKAFKAEHTDSERVFTMLSREVELEVAEKEN